MQHIGLVLLIAGVALCALFGARNPAIIDARTAAQRTVALYNQSAGEAWQAYCTAVPELAEDAAACTTAVPVLPELAAAPEEAEARKDAISRHVVTLRDARDDLHTDAGKAFVTWLMLFEARERAAVDANLMTAPSTGARLSAWFAISGWPFLAGLVLIGAGGMLARRAVAADARAEPKPEDSGRPAKDFGTLLGEVRAVVDGLTSRLAAESLEETERDAIKNAIELLQADKIELMVEARGRVEARFGMAGFAAIFGPFSAGERNLNRVWSALVDEHQPEALSSIQVAAREFGRASDELEKLAKV